MTAERALHPGVDFTDWADRKLAHGFDILDNLIAEVRAWNVANPIYLDAVNVSDTEIEMRVQSDPPRPPVEDWSLKLGDAIHAFRTAFDTVAWHLAHLDGATPGRVYFPLVEDEAKWEERARGLPTIPPEFLERMSQLQKWKYPAAWPLGELHQLDIDDKHKGLFRATANAGEMQANLPISLSRPVAEWPLDLKLDMPHGGAPVEAGSVVATISTDEQITAGTTPRSTVSIDLAIEVEGSVYRIEQWGDQIKGYLRFALDSIYYGRETAATMNGINIEYPTAADG